MNLQETIAAHPDAPAYLSDDGRVAVLDRDGDAFIHTPGRLGSPIMHPNAVQGNWRPLTTEEQCYPDLAGHLDTLVNERSHAEEAVAEMQDAIAGYKAKTAELEAELAEVEEDRPQPPAPLPGMWTKHTYYRDPDEVVKLRNRVEELTRSLGKAREGHETDISGWEEERAELQTRLAELEAELARWKDGSAMVGEELKRGGIIQTCWADYGDGHLVNSHFDPMASVKQYELVIPLTAPLPGEHKPEPIPEDYERCGEPIADTPPPDWQTRIEAIRELANGASKTARDNERLHRLTDERTADAFCWLARLFDVVHDNSAELAALLQPDGRDKTGLRRNCIPGERPTPNQGAE